MIQQNCSLIARPNICNDVGDRVKKLIYHLMPLVLTILPLMACQHNGESDQKPTDSDFISGIQDVLPNSWEMEVIDQKGTMGHPHGLEEPLFRIDFVDHTHQFRDEGGRAISPSARLYFYDIRDKDPILETIKIEAMYSWDIPDYFDETVEHIIVTSPLYTNGGHYSEEAMALYQPIDRALKEYFKLHR
jgi:hypothetical protein